MRVGRFAKNIVVSAMCYAQLVQNVTAEAATSETQASRILNISATVFDLYPKPQPFGKGYDLGVSLEVTGLPEIDPTVGTAKIKIPNPSYLLTPTVHGQFGFNTKAGHIIALRSWAGSLPPGSEAVLGIKPSVFHYLGGAEIGGAFAVSATSRAVFALFGQYSGAEVKGKIASSEKNDRFTSSTTLLGIGVGAQHSPKKDFVGFAELRFFKKTTSSGFDIGDDSTKVRVTDDLSRDAVFGFPLLLSAGLQYSDYTVTLSEAFVPSRALLPSFKLSWNFIVDQNRKSEPILKELRPHANPEAILQKPDAEATAPKEQEDAKTPEAKTPEAKKSEAKTPEAKTPEAKTPEAKKPEKLKKNLPKKGSAK